MSYRDEHGDIILTKEEQKELYYRLTHPDAESIALRDKFLEDFNKKFTTKFNADGSIECFDNIDYTNPGPVDDPQYMPSMNKEEVFKEKETKEKLEQISKLLSENMEKAEEFFGNQIGWHDRHDAFDKAYRQSCEEESERLSRELHEYCNKSSDIACKDIDCKDCLSEYIINSLGYRKFMETGKSTASWIINEIVKLCKMKGMTVDVIERNLHALAETLDIEVKE